MVIFHSYVSLPEGRIIDHWIIGLQTCNNYPKKISLINGSTAHWVLTWCRLFFFCRFSGFWALMSVLCFSAWYSVEPKSPMTGKSCGYFSRDQSGHPMGSVCLKWGDDFHNNEYIPPGYHGELVFECTCLCWI